MKPIDTMLAQLNRGEISRRDFIQRAGALGLAASIPLAFSGSAMAMTPKRGGHLRVATTQGSSTDSLDPIKLTSGHTNFLHYTIHGQLTEIDVNGQLQPLLAESFETGSDASEWIFHLRKDVEFHNGKKLEAADVVASLARHRGEDSASAMKSFMEEVIDIKADDKHTVRMKLKTASVDFPVILGASSLSILPSNNGKIEQFNIGCGAYMLESFEPGQHSKLKKFPNFYRSDRGYVDSAELLTIADGTARLNALITGAVDVIGDVDSNAADRLARNSKVNVQDVASTQHYTFPMRTDLAPFDNNHVRMALKLSIDREDVLERILSGHGVIGNDHPISPANRYFNTELEQRAYDPEKAKWHLKQAGMSNLKVKLSASDGLYAGAVDTAVLFSEHAKKSGIELVPNRVPDDGYWSDVWLKHPWCASYWSGRPTEDWMFTQGYSDTSNWNETFWKNERFNKLLVSARGELKNSTRRDMYWEMQEICRDDCGSVIHVFANHITANSKKVGVPAKLAGNWEFDGYKMFERWWINS
ncbi:MAG: peptide/nickel transport system substrate-binding protein [Gammaproteobacteria bacterium]|jgi:peptide/nickel transport system substrate-binding protein